MRLRPRFVKGGAILRMEICRNEDVERTENQVFGIIVGDRLPDYVEVLRRWHGVTQDRRAGWTPED
ncbi:MAG: hypothetical protein ACRD1X_01820 [Vicinamibacteria bacterium]